MNAIKPLAVIAGVVVIVALLAIGGISAAADYQQSAAMREAAQAARISAQGQTLSTTVIAILVILVILPLLALAGFLAFRVISMQKQIESMKDNPGKWVSGPNANYQRIGAPQYVPRLEDRPVTIGELKALFEQIQPARLPAQNYEQQPQVYDFTEF